MSDLCQSITQIVHRIRYTITLFTFHLTLVGDGSQTLLTTPVALQQILSGAPLINCQPRSFILQIASLATLLDQPLGANR
ncbi:hypothetical protein C3469_26055 [Mycobacterium kansasii]|nr:hypothetical protein C3B43_27780 [Mycobacterium kansasii]POX94839.1 hypothetical protein C3477_26660 [Mycobacterium kansasii]POY12149.1 hypothetical protein C3476_28015 [Mycobacterium kansasii]POY19636.1 hypothetical protein C3469_26055 [Mycobacterium kansasii]POY31308.1 hypothetical protein C3478_17420 [Mycobacterium kansasii]